MSEQTLEWWRDRAREADRRYDEMRRQLRREFELRTQALQAMNDRLLGLLSGKIAMEPAPPIYVCKCRGAAGPTKGTR